ncbi:uncharacterized protein LOC124881049 [Girardinichthys multiradiatus]|uniref:uncharacterized protein LOC124881049 n=1 Tax=Girardinichthys multiradiatus TaxID=208333 RepID=UPI001FAB9353|nr:uncharacterized protein LOC124881049 [Girardinichthys multiradiatus]
MEIKTKTLKKLDLVIQKLQKEGEDDLQDPAAHHPQLMSLCSNICSEWDTELLSGRGEPQHHSGVDLHHQTSWILETTFILCELIAPPRELVLYQVHEGVEVSESQDEQFSGRVQSDKDVLREGRIRLHVSRLRTEDSGLYPCDVMNDEGSGSGRCRLNVSAAADVSQTQRPTVDPEPEGPGWIFLYVLLGLTAAAAAALMVKLLLSSVVYQNPEGS